VAREQDGEALRQHFLKGGCATLQVVRSSERRGSLITRKIRWPSGSICARRQQEVTGGVGEVISRRRGISGDMERRVMRKLEKPSTSA